jgi:hypothetical protein
MKLLKLSQILKNVIDCTGVKSLAILLVIKTLIHLKWLEFVKKVKQIFLV